MAAEKTQIIPVLCLGNGGSGPNRAVSEDPGSEHTAEDETAREIVDAEVRRQVARYKHKLREFKLTVIGTAVFLVFWVVLLLIGTLDHHMSVSWRRFFVTCGVFECLFWLYLVVGHLREYGLSIPKISDFSNEEHQLPPVGHDQLSVSQREAGTRQRNCCVHTLPVPPACPPKIHKPLTIISTVLPKSNPIPPKSAGYCSSLPTKNASKPTPPAAARRGGRTLSLSAPPQHCEATRRLLVANLRLPPLHADHKHVADDDFTSSSYLGTAGKGYALLVGPAAYPRRHVRSYTPAARGGPLALLVTALDEGLGSIHLVATNTTTASGALTDQLVDGMEELFQFVVARIFSFTDLLPTSVRQLARSATANGSITAFTDLLPTSVRQLARSAAANGSITAHGSAFYTDLVHYGKCSSAASFSSSLKGWIPAIFPCSTSPAFQSTRPSASPGNVKEHH
nr:uncharacterized protein LOC107277992 [Oryza sativa Japonica Group]